MYTRLDNHKNVCAQTINVGMNIQHRIICEDIHVQLERIKEQAAVLFFKVQVQVLVCLTTGP
jgi:hypothetical protein